MIQTLTNMGLSKRRLLAIATALLLTVSAFSSFGSLVPAQAGATNDATVTVRAKGTTGTERMHLYVNNNGYLETWDVTTDYQDYTYTPEYTGYAPTVSDDLKVLFGSTAGSVNGVVKKLQIDYIIVNGVQYESESPDTLARGSVPAGSNNCDPQGYQQNDTLRCNNAFFRYNVPAGTVLTDPNDTDLDSEPNSTDLCPFTTVYDHRTLENGCQQDNDLDLYYTDADPSASNFDPDDNDDCNPDPSAPHCSSSSSDSVTIRAKGTTGTETMRLYANNNQLLATWTVGTSYANYTFTPSSPITVNNSDLKVRSGAAGNHNGVVKKLQIDYVVVEGVQYESEDAATLARGSVAAGSNSCEPQGYQQNDTLRCSNGFFKYAVPAGLVLQP